MVTFIAKRQKQAFLIKYYNKPETQKPIATCKCATVKNKITIFLPSPLLYLLHACVSTSMAIRELKSTG